MASARGGLALLGIVSQLGALALPCPSVAGPLPRDGSHASHANPAQPAEHEHGHEHGHGRPAHAAQEGTTRLEVTARCPCGCGGGAPSQDGVAGRLGDALPRVRDPAPPPALGPPVSLAAPRLPEAPPRAIDRVPI